VQTAPISLAAMPPDIRWQQRFANFCQALDQLETFFQLDGEAWLAMVQDRNLTSHTYNRSTAEQVSERVQATAAEEGDG
jgi:hypothetical protein